MAGVCVAELGQEGRDGAARRIRDDGAVEIDPPVPASMKDLLPCETRLTVWTVVYPRGLALIGPRSAPAAPAEPTEEPWPPRPRAPRLSRAPPQGLRVPPTSGGVRGALSADRDGGSPRGHPRSPGSRTSTFPAVWRLLQQGRAARSPLSGGPRRPRSATPIRRSTSGPRRSREAR